MGGRGAASGMSDDKKPYGSEYHSVYQDGNIKFVVKNNGSATAPLETMTRGRIYVTVAGDDNVDKLKAITFYDRSNKRFNQIDLDHYHKINGKPERPHVQSGYYHDGEGRLLTVKETKIVDRVMKAWYRYKQK